MRSKSRSHSPWPEEARFLPGTDIDQIGIRRGRDGRPFSASAPELASKRKITRVWRWSAPFIRSGLSNSKNTIVSSSQSAVGIADRRMDVTSRPPGLQLRPGFLAIIARRMDRLMFGSKYRLESAFAANFAESL